MERIRADHDEILGTELSTVAAQLVEDPHKISLLPYTNAVLKEAMRLFPIASSIRTS